MTYRIPFHSHRNPGGISATPDHPRGFGVRALLLVTIAAVTMLPVLALGVSQVQRWEVVELERADRESELAATTVAYDVEQFIISHTRAVEALAATVEAAQTSDPEFLQRVVTNQRQRLPYLDLMYIADANARSIVTDPILSPEGKPNAGLDYSDRDYYLKMIAADATAVSRVQIGRVTRVPNVQIAAPIRDATGAIVGFAEGSVNLSGIQTLIEPVSQLHPQVQIVVLDRLGRAIAHPDPVARRDVRDFSDLAIYSPTQQGSPGIRQGLDEAGVSVRGVVAPIKRIDLGWTTIVTRSEDAIRQQAAEARQQTFTAAFMTLGLCLALTLFVARTLSRPIIHLATGVAAVGRGDFATSLPSPALWYPRELTALILSIKAMADALGSRTQQLEQQVTLRTQALTQANQELQEASRLKSEFLANMSHELRTPLNGIIGFSELMYDEKRGPVSPVHQECLGDILSSSHHLLTLINDVLDLAKVESGKMEFHPEVVDISALITEVRETVRPLANDKELRIEIDLAAGIGPLSTDPSRLKQVLYNYLSNAIKFTPARGLITVRVLPEGTEQFRIEVEDTGIGIAPADLARLFVEFEQLDIGATKRYQGTGLGLALTKRLVEQQGGAVGVRSTLGQGSIFFATLPRTVSGITAAGGPKTDPVENPDASGKPPTRLPVHIAEAVA